MVEIGFEIHVQLTCTRMISAPALAMANAIACPIPLVPPLQVAELVLYDRFRTTRTYVIRAVFPSRENNDVRYWEAMVIVSIGWGEL